METGSRYLVAPIALSALTRERTGQPVQRTTSVETESPTQSKLKELLAKPLTPDSAVEIALLNNKGFQASFAELGVAEADLVQAGRMSNPGLSFARLRGGDEVEIDRSVIFDLVGRLPAALSSGAEPMKTWRGLRIVIAVLRIESIALFLVLAAAAILATSAPPG